MNRQNSEKLFEKAKRLIPGGVNSPVRAFRAVGGTPLFIKNGNGSKLTDEDGNEFIDYCMSWGPLILGHADADVIKAVQETAADGTSFGAPHAKEVALAQLVTDAFESIEKVRFVNSGTEATMSAIRLARGFTKRDKIVKFEGCYHGHADFLLVAAGSGIATLAIPDSAGVTAPNAKDTVPLPYNNIDALSAYLEKEGENTAAVIMEPVPCNYGLILPEEGYLSEVRRLCDRYGTLLIFDEVITGFRLSYGGAQKHFGVKADITTLGKIIGGGLPIGAYGGRADIMNTVAPDGPVYQAGTLSGNPLAMAAGIAALGKLSNGAAYAELERKASLFKAALAPALEKYRGRLLFQDIASIFAFCFTNLEHIKNVDDIKKADTKAFAAFHAEMLSRGIYLAPSGFEVGFISLAHSDSDIEKTAQAVAESLSVVLG